MLSYDISETLFFRYFSFDQNDKSDSDLYFVIFQNMNNDEFIFTQYEYQISRKGFLAIYTLFSSNKCTKGLIYF